MGNGSTDKERIERARKIQGAESERKRTANRHSTEAQRQILDQAKTTIAERNNAALNRLLTSVQWIDAAGVKRSATGPTVALPSDSSGVFARSNRRSIAAIVRACRRADKVVDDLIDVLRQEPSALPIDLEVYMDKLTADLPALDTIKLEITQEPGAKKPAVKSGI
jgi:hypothetical protein